MVETSQSFLDIKVRPIAQGGKPCDQTEVPLSSLCNEKRATLVVNVASKWGLTDSTYKALVELQNSDPPPNIVLAPCNQFGGQEPDSEDKIVEFAHAYGFKGIILGKLDVKGDNAHPMYKWFAAQKECKNLAEPKWNFAKFLVSGTQAHSFYAHGTPVKDFSETIAKINSTLWGILNPLRLRRRWLVRNRATQWRCDDKLSRVICDRF